MVSKKPSSPLHLEPTISIPIVPILANPMFVESMYVVVVWHKNLVFNFTQSKYCKRLNNLRI